MSGSRPISVILGILSVTSLLLLSGPPEAAAARQGAPLHAVGRLPAGAATPGAQLWVDRYEGPGYGDDHPTALGVSPDGSTVFVTGNSWATSSCCYSDYATVAIDASTGAKLWVSRYNGGYGNDYATALGVSPDGSTVFVTGYSPSSMNDWDYATVAIDASTGAKLWVSRYNGGYGSDTAYALGVSPDGSTVFVTGYSQGSAGDGDYATVAVDATTGAKRWVSRYFGPAGNDIATALGVSPDGSTVFVTGYSAGSTSAFDYATVAIDASTGATLWVSRYNGGLGHDYATALGVSPDGSTLFVTGYSTGSGGDLDYATVALAASTGAKRWVSRYFGPAGADAAAALGMSPDGSTVFVTGYSSGVTSGHDYATVAIDASTGAKLWVSRYNGPSNLTDEAVVLRVSPDGSTVFVTGYSSGVTSGHDYATVAVDASTGAKLWVSRYNGPLSGPDEAFALGVSPDGSTVFVMGYSLGLTFYDDYATVAYSTT